jgi:hypothetical protein
VVSVKPTPIAARRMGGVPHVRQVLEVARIPRPWLVSRLAGHVVVDLGPGDRADDLRRAVMALTAAGYVTEHTPDANAVIVGVPRP